MNVTRSINTSKVGSAEQHDESNLKSPPGSPQHVWATLGANPSPQEATQYLEDHIHERSVMKCDQEDIDRETGEQGSLNLLYLVLGRMLAYELARGRPILNGKDTQNKEAMGDYVEYKKEVFAAWTKRCVIMNKIRKADGDERVHKDELKDAVANAPEMLIFLPGTTETRKKAAEDARQKGREPINYWKYLPKEWRGSVQKSDSNSMDEWSGEDL